MIRSPILNHEHQETFARPNPGVCNVCSRLQGALKLYRDLKEGIPCDPVKLAQILCIVFHSGRLKFDGETIVVRASNSLNKLKFI